MKKIVQAQQQCTVQICHQFLKFIFSSFNDPDSLLCSVLHRTIILHCAVLYYIQYTVLHCSISTLNSIVWDCITLFYIALL